MLGLWWGERQGQLGSDPRGEARALSRVLKAGAAAGTPGPGWIPGIHSHPASLFSFVGGSLVGRDCRAMVMGAGKPSNPFSFMRPFLGSRGALSDLSIVCMLGRELI